MLCYKLKVILWYDFFKFYTPSLYLIYMADIFIWDNILAQINTLRLRLKVNKILKNNMYRKIYTYYFLSFIIQYN